MPSTSLPTTLVNPYLIYNFIAKYEVANTHVGSRPGTTVAWPGWC